MKTSVKTLLIALILLVGIGFVPVDNAVRAVSNAVIGYAWSDNIGWIEFNPDFGGVFVDSETGDFSGYAWSENIGWISFEPADVAGCPPGTPGNCVTNLDTTGGVGVVTGWAKAISAYGSGWGGWISLSGDSPDYIVSMNLGTGDFSGYAWGSDIVGWVSFGGIIPQGGGRYEVSCPECVGLEADISDLSVSLSANPSSGETPLSSMLTANVSGIATGDITYKFDCENDGIYEYNFVSSNETENRNCEYNSVGTYAAVVYVEREEFSDSGSASITAVEPSSDFSLSISGNIDATIVEEGNTLSTETVITVINAINFSDDVSLTFQSISPAIPGTGGIFGDPVLNLSEYSIGSTFALSIPSGGELQGSYTVTIRGEGGGLVRTVELGLNVESFEPKWEEF